jgi:hypothetical protein
MCFVLSSPSEKSPEGEGGCAVHCRPGQAKKGWNQTFESINLFDR